MTLTATVLYVMGFFVWYDTASSVYKSSVPGDRYSTHYYDGPGHRWLNPPVDRDNVDSIFWPMKKLYIVVCIKTNPKLENPNNPPWKQ